MVEKSFTVLSYEILRRAGKDGMHYKALAQEILKAGKTTKGRTPDQTVLAILERDIRFEKVGKGVYRVRDSPDAEARSELTVSERTGQVPSQS